MSERWSPRRIPWGKRLASKEAWHWSLFRVIGTVTNSSVVVSYVRILTGLETEPGPGLASKWYEDDSQRLSQDKLSTGWSSWVRCWLIQLSQVVWRSFGHYGLRWRQILTAYFVILIHITPDDAPFRLRITRRWPMRGLHLLVRWFTMANKYNCRRWVTNETRDLSQLQKGSM